MTLLITIGNKHTRIAASINVLSKVVKCKVFIRSMVVVSSDPFMRTLFQEGSVEWGSVYYSIHLPTHWPCNLTAMVVLFLGGWSIPFNSIPPKTLAL